MGAAGTLPRMTNSSIFRTAVAAAVVVGAGVGASGALAANVQQSDQARCSRANKGFVVGDSVVDAVNYLTGKRNPLSAVVGGGVVSGSVNRQFDEGVAIVKTNLAKYPNACAVVVVLGTNNDVRPEQWAALMNVVKRVPRVVVVNTYTKNWRQEEPWMERLNAAIAALPSKYKNVRVANWAALAPSLSSTELPDGVHPDTVSAANKFTSTVVAALRAR